MPPRIGVLGGTFDPVHRGHLAAALAAADALQLDRVILVPAGDPYHRDAPAASGEDRLAMLEAAIADEPRLATSRVDLDREGPTYTVDTLRDLHAEHPDAELVLLLGSDALVALPGWHDPQAITALATIAGFARPGQELARPDLPGALVLLPFEPLPVSSTLVRAAIAEGRELDGLVPPQVAEIIRGRRLYGAP